jgi:hypothetical protein
MKSASLKYQPIEGKTYTLFGNYQSTSEYYQIISSFADKILIDNDIKFILKTI